MDAFWRSFWAYWGKSSGGILPPMQSSSDDWLRGGKMPPLLRPSRPHTVLVTIPQLHV